MITIAIQRRMKFATFFLFHFKVPFRSQQVHCGWTQESSHKWGGQATQSSLVDISRLEVRSMNSQTLD
jgi:hypothetical protein